jgi:class 3 adenylate cyclase/TolB-like protein/Tfp pilus assembly protein PilF
VVAVEDSHLKRKLIAVLFADVVGYSKLMSVDEAGTHRVVVDRVKSVIEPKVTENNGRLIRTIGDGFLIGFDSAIDAVSCALDIQQEFSKHNIGKARNQGIQLRIGINTGDVIIDDRDVYGHNVNIAARLEGIAEPGEIYVTSGVRDQLQGYPDLTFEDRGYRKAKNIDRPIHVFRVRRIERQQHQSRLRQIKPFWRQLTPFRFILQPRKAMMMAVALGAVATIGALPVRPDYSVFSPPAAIMVAPFRNASGNPEEDYFADAITDDITTDLSRLSDTSVISSATAFTYKSKLLDPRELRREFGIDYLLEGTVRKTGTTIQTNAQLVYTRTAIQVWAERFDNEFCDLPELQNAITGQIASSLRIHLIKDESRRAFVERPTDPDAVDLRLHAMAVLLSSITQQHHLAARQYLNESLRLNPDSADSWSQLAHVMMNDYFNHWGEPNESLTDLLQNAGDAVQKALQLDPSVALAHQADGLVRRAKGDHKGALDAFDRAVQLDPNFARAYAQKANQLVMVGRPKEAPPLVLKAIALSPRDPVIGVFYWILGRAYFVSKDYDDAIVWLRKSVELLPTVFYNRAYLLAAYALTGGHQTEGITALREYKSGYSPYTIERLREVYEKENPQDNPVMKDALQELYRGLQLAGI